MTEATAAGAYAPPPAGQRPRVSAASFRDLTARLKKANAAPSAVAAASIAPQQLHVPDLMPPPAAWTMEPPAPQLPPDPTPASAPEDMVLQFEPPPVVAQANVEPPPPATPVPAIETFETPLPDVATPEIQASPSEQPEPEVVEVSIAEVPESVAHGPAIAADDAAEAARKEALSRKDELELDVIWRSLLAKPTVEERGQFLKDIAELMAAEGLEMPALAPEHDLSTIAPAQVTSAVEPLAIEGDVEAEAAPGEAGELVASLAEEDTSGDKAELARSLLDMMSSGSSSGLPHERALAADTLLRLLPKLELKPLVMMSQRLAKADNPPHMLVARLIRDPRVEVAGPLLEDCPQISDKDLETVVTEGAAPKLRMLARRRHLTAAISDALIKTEDASVHLTLVRNMDAQISQEGFVSLIQSAEREKELLAPLCTRHDLPAPLAFELFWLAPPQLRRFILSRFLTDSETLTKILKITLSTNEPEDAGNRDTSHQHMLVEALERAARGKLDVASEELGQVLLISPATALRVLNDPEGEPLVVLLKVAGFPRQALPGLLRRFRDSDLSLMSSGRDIEELQSIFDTLSFNKARILLTYWDWAQRKTGPYAPMH
jgi:uncharacterized protein (DUF2336 family)